MLDLEGRRSAVAVLLVAAGMCYVHSAAAQCIPVGGEGPDLVIGDIALGVTNYPSVGDLEVVTFGFTQCNIGNTAVTSITSSTQHPVTTQSLFKFKRSGGFSRIEQIEQIGQSWVFHEFFPLNGILCCSDCQFVDNMHLGAHCANAHSSSSIGFQNGLGPKWQVNASNGVFTFPPANPTFTGAAARRLAVNISDLEPSSTLVRYYAEVCSIAPDEAAAGNGSNNASWREVTVTGSGTAWNFGVTGATAIGHAAINAWKEVVPSVILTNVDIPNDGRFIVASNVTSLFNRQFRYEYAVYNLNSDRSCGTFSVPVSNATTVFVIGFHDVDYRAGDGPGNVNFSSADWNGVQSDGALTWATESFMANESANAIRWGTLYNFRFDCGRPPMNGQVALGLFKPGATDAGFAAAIVPSPCNADFNEDGSLDFFDYLDFVDTFSNLGLRAEFNGDGVVDFFDYLDFVDAFGRGC